MVAASPPSAPVAIVQYSAALFPNPLLPPMSQLGTFSIPAQAVPQKKQDDRDELVEVGTMLAILKLVLG